MSKPFHLFLSLFSYDPFFLSLDLEPGAPFTLHSLHIRSIFTTFKIMIPARNSLALALALGLITSSSAAPPTLLASRALSAADLLANGQDAQSLNAQFASLSANDSCTGASFFNIDFHSSS
jgi:hypothetical protein